MHYHDNNRIKTSTKAYKCINSHKPQQIDALSPASVGDLTKTCTTKCFTSKKYYCLVQQNQSKITHKYGFKAIK